MITHVTLEKGCLVPTHAHENEQFVCLLEGRMRFRLGADGAARRELVIKAGDVLLLPSKLPHEAEALERSIVLDVFSPPSAETGIDRPRRGH
jgi:quercetin dioxygenase-like cupin family protein